MSVMQSQHTNDHLLTNLQTYDGKSDKSFMDWITQVEKIAT